MISPDICSISVLPVCDVKIDPEFVFAAFLLKGGEHSGLVVSDDADEDDFSVTFVTIFFVA